MRAPRPLPSELSNRVFTRAELIERGFSDSRLTARDVQKLGRGLYRHRSEAAEGGDLAIPGDLYGIQARAPGSWYSYETACAIYEVVVPHRSTPGPVHLSLPHQVRSLSQLLAVTTHRPDHVIEGEIRCVNRLRVSSPERVFLEMASRLAEPALVALGDQLVRVPRAGFEGRSTPWTTPKRLWHCLGQHPSTAGIRNARAAAKLVRIGADSVPETLLRLSILQAGLPEPQLQWRLDRADPTSPIADLAYPEHRIALQYEGAHHFTPEQQAADQWRNGRFHSQGWMMLLVNRVDLRAGFRGAISRLVSALGQQG